jgi:hypothetical protein
MVVESPQAWQRYNHMQQDYGDFPQYTLGPAPAQTYNSSAMMDTVPEYFPYAPGGYPSPDDLSVPVTDLSYSWQNFVSQFKD